MTCKEVFDGMEGKFKEFGLTNVYGTYQFNIDGPGGGDWHAICHGNFVTVKEGCASEPDVTISTNCANVVKLVEGSLNPHLAFLTGQVKVKGNMWLLVKIGRLLSV